MTNRQFEEQVGVTKVFSSEGRASITIPDLQSTSAVTLNTAPLTANSSFYLIPDVRNSGIYTGLNLPQYRAAWDYRSYSNWFDNNYDSPKWQGRLASGIPNDVSITGTWGWPAIPDEVMHATKVLAAWYTKRPDAVLSNAIQTPEGEIILAEIPPEVQQFIQQWRIPVDSAVSV